MGIQLAPSRHVLSQRQAALLQFDRKSSEDLHWIQTTRTHPLLNRHLVHDLGGSWQSWRESWGGPEAGKSYTSPGQPISFIQVFERKMAGDCGCQRAFCVATTCRFLCLNHLSLETGVLKVSNGQKNAGEVGWNSPHSLQVGAGPLGWTFVAIIRPVDVVDGWTARLRAMAIQLADWAVRTCSKIGNHTIPYHTIPYHNIT